MGFPVSVSFGLGELAAGLSVLGFLPYILDTMRGRTRPERVTWAIWAVLSSISAAALWATGPSAALAFAVVQAGCTAFIATLALRFGTWRAVTRFDGCVLAGAAIGLGLWAMTDSAAYALAISIAVSAVGSLPTLLKAFIAPASETWSAWALLLVAGLLAVLAVGARDPVALAYPLYLVVLYTAVLTALTLGRMRQAPDARRGLLLARALG